jgi:hypothetical protein
MRSLKLGLLSMALRQANPKLKIKNMGVLNITSKKVNINGVYAKEIQDVVRVMKTQSSLYRKFSENMRSVIDDNSLYDNDYGQSWMHMLKRKFEERANLLEDMPGQEFNFKKTNESIGKIDSYINGEGSKAHIIEMLKERQHWIERHSDPDDLLRGKDQEYLYIAGLLKEMTSVPTYENLSTNDLDKFRMQFSPSHNIDHEIISWGQDKIMNGKNYVQDVVARWQRRKLYPMVTEYNTRFFQQNPDLRTKLANYLSDFSGKKFEKMFKTTKIYDQNGNQVEINSMEIHWNEKDPETRIAIQRGQISSKDVEFGRFIVETHAQQMIKNLVHQHRYEVGQKYTEEDAKKELETKWTKGMIPVMPASANQMIMKGIIGGTGKEGRRAGYKKFMDQLSNIDDIFDESGVERKSDTKKEKILKGVTDYFMHQIGTESEFGSDSRMRIMGIANDGTGPVLVDELANKNLNKNLELTIMYMVTSSERKRHFEKEVVPYVNAAQMFLHNHNVMQLQGAQDNSIQYFKNYVDTVIKGMPDKLNAKVPIPFFGKEIDVDNVTNLMIRTATFGGLAYNVPVGLTSGLMNSVQFFNNAWANDVARNGMYGAKEARKAVRMFGTKKGRELIEGIMEQYKLADMSESDLMHNPRRRISNKNLFTSHHAHWLNWYSDYYIRGIVGLAQMIKDGSIAAYTMKNGELVYNESRDPRWAGKEGKFLKEHIKEQLVEQNYMLSTDGPMPRGYDDREARVLKWIADKFIVGSYDETTRTMLSRQTTTMPFIQFASFLPDKMVNYFGSKKYSPVGGQYKVMRDKAKEMETVWQRYTQEGIMVTFSNLAKELRTNGFRDMRSWSELEPHERYNVAKFGLDMGMMVVMFALYAGLSHIDWDDEDTSPIDSKFIKIFRNGAWDLLVWNPVTASETFAALPSLEMAQRLAHIFIGDFSEVERVLPGSTTIKAIGELIPEQTEE